MHSPNLRLAAQPGEARDLLLASFLTSIYNATIIGIIMIIIITCKTIGGEVVLAFTGLFIDVLIMLEQTKTFLQPLYPLLV